MSRGMHCLKVEFTPEEWQKLWSMSYGNPTAYAYSVLNNTIRSYINSEVEKANAAYAYRQIPQNIPTFDIIRGG